MGFKTQIYIVDNGSSEIDFYQLEKWVQQHSNVTLIRNLANLGFSAGMNVGIHCALPLNPKHVWLLNNDTIVDPESARSFVSYMELHPEVVIAGATIVNYAGAIVHCTGGYRYYKWLGCNRPMNKHTPLHLLDTIAEPNLDYVDGASIWLRGSFIARLGGLPCYTYLYFEELFLNSYLSRDEHIGWCRSAIVHHKQGSSSPTTKLRERSTYHAAFSAFTYTRRLHPICLPTVILTRLLGISLRALYWQQPGLFPAIFRAFNDFLVGRPADPS
jgi:GT2 family glycosyltransferase